MTTTLWVLQGLLAFAFTGAGTMKLMKSRAELAEKMGWVEDFSEGQIKTIGALEGLGALGLILPVALGILPILTGVAAACLTLTMVGATAVHLKRGEFGESAPGAVLGLLSAFVAYSHLAG
ncbi:MAG: DoxX family protein [Deltaproteobacteria bacterium]|nr:DoxX family protein [Deltaproteobacteria bacterium]